MRKQRKPRLARGGLAMPTYDGVQKYRAAGFDDVRAYVRAFNDANHLHHTPFESEPREVAKGAA